MDYSEIKRLIIKKRYFLGYSLLILLSLVLVYSVFIEEGAPDIFFRENFFTIAFFGLAILIIHNVFMTYYRCRQFHNLLINSDLKDNTAKPCRIIIEKYSYKTTAFRTNYIATVTPSPRPTNAICIETTEYLLLFFAVDYFGIFQEVLKPHVFLKTDKDFHRAKTKNVKIIRDFKTVDTEQNRKFIFTNKQGIKSVIIDGLCGALPEAKGKGGVQMALFFVAVVVIASFGCCSRLMIYDLQLFKFGAKVGKVEKSFSILQKDFFSNI